VGAFGGFVFPLFLGISKDLFEKGQARGVFTYTIFCIIGISVSIYLIKTLKEKASKKSSEQKY
jgi:nitrate/nitrite transporter NarK